MEVGSNYITDIREGLYNPVNDPKTTSKVNWYQFKIPVRNPDDVIGNISDFKSIRFMRMFMRGFERQIITRFATFELVRGEWRRYDNPILDPGDYQTGDYGNETNFTVATVSIEENSGRSPIPYVLPPGIDREIYYGTTAYMEQNEQSIELTISDLADGDARGIYKTTDFDFRQYKKLKMYVHGEKLKEKEELYYGDLTAFIRIGSDFTENYYEYEVPIQFTKWGEQNRDSIWPEINNFDINLEKLVEVKQNRNEALREPNTSLKLNKPYVEYDGKNKITVVGSPSISDVDAILIGVRNPRQESVASGDDGNAKSVIVWFDELRLTDYKRSYGLGCHRKS